VSGGGREQGAKAMTIKVLGIDHVVLRVADVERALAFYCDVLGCREERRVADIGLIQLRAGAALIDLVGVDGELGRAGGAAPGAEGRNVDHVALRIEVFDEAALRTHLEAHGVAAGEVKRRYGAEGDGPSLYIEDPDGNTVELKGPADG
jgi:catechol 2,3-dioxygenase-like lactoylglutathione lyase family enzyme